MKMGRCGVGVCKRSSCLQVFANLKLYSLIAGLVILGVTAAYSYMSAVLSTTQALYSFNATETGIWYAMFEVGSILSNIFASYFLTKKHIPHVLTIGLTLVTLGCFMHGIPHFAVTYEDRIKSLTDGNSATNLINEGLCQMNASNTTSAEIVAPDPQRSLSVIILYCIGGFIMGAGYAPFWSLGLVYIDNNVKDLHGSSAYIGVILAFYTVGPVVGFGVGALFLSMYVTLKDTYLTPDDSQWIGAWWIGYLLFAAFLAIFIAPIMMFPKRLTQQESEDEYKDSQIVSSTNELVVREESTNNSAEEDNSDEFRKASELLPTLGGLFINPLWMIESLCACAASYFISGWLGFMPKYFETQFYLSAWNANLLAGLPAPFLSCFAIFLGGWVATKYRLTLQQDAAFVFFSCALSTLFLIPTTFFNCPQSPIQEVPSNYTSCVSACYCDPAEYNPVCYEGVSYRSPCFAGCYNYTKVGEDITYHKCFCTEDISMSAGACSDPTCLAAYFHAICAVLATMTFTASSSAGVNLIMRSVAEDDKSLALGIQSGLTSLLAWIPAPILYGAVIDSTCVHWEHPGGLPDDPDYWGYCQEYDNPGYRYKFTSLTIGMQALTTLLGGVGWAVSYLPRYKKDTVYNVEKIEAEKSNGNEQEMKISDITT